LAADTLRTLAESERAQRQGKFTEAEQSLQAAMALAANRSLSAQAQDALLDLHLEQARYPAAWRRGRIRTFAGVARAEGGRESAGEPGHLKTQRTGPAKELLHRE